MKYIGLDIHKRYCFATVMDEDGEVLKQERITARDEDILNFLSRIDGEAKIVMESTGLWEHIYDLIEGEGYEVILAHPLKTRAIAEARIKTDRVDSEILAHLLRSNLIPSSYVPPKEIRELRSLVRQRFFLKRHSTSIKNRIHSELARRGINPEMRYLFSRKGVEYLQSLEIESIQNLLRVLQSIQEEIKRVEDTLYLNYFLQMDEPLLLTTIPGIGFYGALLIIAEIGDVHRFPGPEKLCAYAGLVPSLHQSSSISRYGLITKVGSRYLRWLLVEAVHIHPNLQRASSLSSTRESREGRGRRSLS